MAGPSTVHVRSISMPSRPQPLLLTIEEELNELTISVASTSYATPQMMCNRLREVSTFYENIETLVQLPSNQQALSCSHQKKWVEKELDQSIEILDLCAIMRDNMVAMKEHAQDLCFSLRKNDVVSECKVQAYTRSRKKAHKEIKSCFKSLKTNKYNFRYTLDKDCDVSMTTIRMLIEAREITTSLLLAIFSSLSKTKGEMKDSRWSFVSKTLHKRKVAHEDELEHANEVERLEHLETGLDCLSRQLILNRVSLLNIISL